ncbi:hypothetical protein BSKO_09147 [Bryopsis sp. KO-2023]|nr:hypothetical protein BSKO_09147 [Bryopsis sp. KO-2023]
MRPIGTPPASQTHKCSASNCRGRGGVPLEGDRFRCSGLRSPSLWLSAKRFCQTGRENASKAKRRRGLNLSCSSAPPSNQDLSTSKAKLAVFVSGGGSNFRAIHKACRDGKIHGEIAVVVSNAPSCGGVAYAKDNRIPTLTFPKLKKLRNEEQADGLTTDELVVALRDTFTVDFVLLAGYLKLVPAKVVQAFPRAMLNIHPALLPAFGGQGYYGKRVHEAVVASGARFSGPTVHYVDEEYDRGPILAQRVVSVFPMDNPQKVAARVLQEEHKLFPECVAALCDGRVTWREDGVPIVWSAH